MPALNEAQIRAALTAAKSSQRRYADLLLQSRASKPTRRVAERTALETLLAKPMGCRRCDAGAFEAIRSRHEDEARRYLEKQKAAVLRLSPAVRETLRARAASRRKELEHLLARGRDIPILNFISLDTPALVIPSQDMVISSSHIQPWNSTVKVSGEWDSPYSQDGTDELSFIFVWENTGRNEAVVNVDTALILNGYCSLYASGGTFVYNDVQLSINASLTILQWWNQPPTSPPAQMGQSVNVIFIYAHTDLTFYSYGDPEAAGIEGYYDLSYNTLVVPPQSTIVFEVRLVAQHSIQGDGTMRVDFASGDFEVVCPNVLLQILA